ncbi:tail fiber assembly protein [Pseudomonas sp. 14P_5.3_Bac1]|uniref:tail fiber assembly protein n=1 Tax=Pseudomonas sp. 14P_5.3_Bac1 TaxID=2971622 RepID=UPI0021CAA595|nr:tail fiber assembly protein [Pseudomonas sp. 14P_5.3_Bac1]MCU1780548.1 tail fiber assembly protein [Pseudomonas sp. 14P_5.3_Bac1]
MRTVNYKGSIYVNPDADSLEGIGLSAEDAAEVMAQLMSNEAMQRRDELLQVAAIRIAPLLDAQDLGKATDDEVARLQAWKLYRIELNRIDKQEGFPALINWPVAPI